MNPMYNSENNLKLFPHNTNNKTVRIQAKRKSKNNYNNKIVKKRNVNGIKQQLTFKFVRKMC